MRGEREREDMEGKAANDASSLSQFPLWATAEEACRTDPGNQHRTHTSNKGGKKKDTNSQETLVRDTPGALIPEQLADLWHKCTADFGNQRKASKTRGCWHLEATAANPEGGGESEGDRSWQQAAVTTKVFSSPETDLACARSSAINTGGKLTSSTGFPRKANQGE